jgi:long-chain fatty acid transport protein
MVKKGKIFVLVFLCVCFLSSLAGANGLNLNSLGTKALAMGGAFVGLADDFSTIYWNPAGMTIFSKKNFGFYLTDIIPSNSYQLTADVPGVGSFTLVNADSASRHYLSGLAAYYHPINEKFVAGFGIYIPSGLGAKWDGADFASASGGNPGLEWRSKIGLITFSPALAYKVNEKLSVGGSLNINYGKFDLATYAGETETPPIVDLGQYEESLSGWGIGLTLSALFKPMDKLSVGATFRTASTVKFTGDATISGMTDLGTALGTPLNVSSNVERDVTWPMWLAAGVAFKPMERLTLTGDLQWTQWSKIDTIESVYTDAFWDAMMTASGEDSRLMNWSNTLQIRLGAEYRLKNYAFRCGYYYDPSPAPDTTMNVLVPSYDFNVITLGFGYNLNGLQLDFGLEYLIGKERNVPFNVVPLVPPLFDIQMPPGYETAMPGTYDLNIFVPTISVSYRF